MYSWTAYWPAQERAARKKCHVSSCASGEVERNSWHIFEHARSRSFCGSPKKKKQSPAWKRATTTGAITASVRAARRREHDDSCASERFSCHRFRPSGPCRKERNDPTETSPQVQEAPVDDQSPDADNTKRAVDENVPLKRDESTLFPQPTKKFQRASATGSTGTRIADGDRVSSPRWLPEFRW